MSSISFFFPSRKIGGVEVMYARIAGKLIEENQCVEICDFSDGIMKQLMSDYNGRYKLTIYEEGKKLSSQSEVCITSLLFLPSAKLIFPKELKLLFWDDHPYNLILFLGHLRLIKEFNHSIFLLYSKLFRKKRYSICRFNLIKALSKNGVVFMCNYNFHLNKRYFRFNDEPRYLPIPISDKRRFQKDINFKQINCSYLGRLDSDKAILCIELMEDVISYNLNNSDCSLKLHIIGNGDKYDLIKEKALLYPDYFVLCGIIKGDVLDEYFKNTIDLSFAVGTSALESAGMGIPTLFMRSTSSSKRLKYNYIWVFDNESYNLSINESIIKNGLEVKQLVDVVNELKMCYSSISEKCYLYVHNNHSLDSVVKLVKGYLASTVLTVEDLI